MVAHARWPTRATPVAGLVPEDLAGLRIRSVAGLARASAEAPPEGGAGEGRPDEGPEREAPDEGRRILILVSNRRGARRLAPHRAQKSRDHDRCLGSSSRSGPRTARTATKPIPS